MAACCGRSSGCRCVIQAATPGPTDPITVTVTGAGSTLSPFTVGASIDLDLIVDDQPCNPVTVAEIGGVPKITNRCTYIFL